ncbi:regulator of chromosome condensation 1/beta-lactamase-inhibitor protein II [Camillea tinctor]|nr:regulator of chromosome condensation 1/beta-lactamase-inhibitor protein II [Camillea tinctor]
MPPKAKNAATAASSKPAPAVKGAAKSTTAKSTTKAAAKPAVKPAVKKATPAPAVKKPAATKAATKKTASAPPTKSKSKTTKAKTKAPAADEDEQSDDEESQKKTTSTKKTESKTTSTKAIGYNPAPKGGKSKKHGLDSDDEEESDDREVKRARKKGPAVAPGLTARRPKRATRPVINKPPTKRLDVFVFGEGSSGELGLGNLKYDGKKPIDVKRPRINHNLDAATVGVVQIACGGMHAIALTHDQKILTWGVNDDKALGRDTTWSGGTKDMDAGSDDGEDDDTGLNPHESTPGEVDVKHFPEGTVFAQVAATDSASFVLTDEGLVYGWGTFRGSDGIIGFSDSIRVQPTPTWISELSQIKQLACGSNHVVALDINGKVFTWGSGGQFQLGRKPLTRLGGPQAGLRPQPCGKFGKKHYATKVAAGSYHSFYMDNDNHVWAWGLNNYSQTGLFDDTGKDDAMVLQPKIVESLEALDINMIAGGEHHSVACTEDGQLLTWGRVDGHQVGQPADLYNEDNAVFDDNNKPRILLEPTPIEGIKATFVAAGTDTSFALDSTGKVFSWGFSANYQTGQGTTDDIEIPTHINNTAIRDRKITWAGAGGQFSIVVAPSAEDDEEGEDNENDKAKDKQSKDDQPQTNGN